MNDGLVGFTIDGKPVSVPRGTLLIRAAEALGIEIPRFCEHPYLDPVGACRQCVVEIEGQKKLVTSCTTPVAEGMVVRTQHTSDEARRAQEGMIELLLINHPLDCPVCDRGGECPLQDQALAFGPGESRYIDPKRVFRKPVPLSPLVLLDRERCVLCTRCTRFCDQISGDRFIEMFERGPAQQVSIAPGEDFRSPFSGNTVQICPVGALTSSTYRFAARPFDLRSADSVCPHCACGCNLRVDVRRGEVVRHLARDNPEVNDAWLCDKGRYAFRFPDAERLQTPMLRVPGLAPASYQDVFRAIADRAAGGRVALLGGGRLTDEDAFAMSKLARKAFRTNDLDHRTHDPAHLPLEAEAAAAAGMPVTYRDVERASVLLVVGLDPREELPILYLRIGKAVRDGDARVFVVGPRRTELTRLGEHLSCLPGTEAPVLREVQTTRASRTPAGRLAGALRAAGERGLILAGPRLGESPGAAESIAALAARFGGRTAHLPRRAGDRGALRAGVHPALLPGGRPVDDASARADVERVWGAIPEAPGAGTREILEAAARREIDVLYLVGVDPLADVPDAGLARRALENARFRVVQDIAPAGYARYADAILPAAAFLEKEGHLTDWEGRSQPLAPVRPPPGLARADWQIFQELSGVLGADLGFRSLRELREEMARLHATQAVPSGEPSPGARRAPRTPPAAPAPAEATPSEGGASGLILFTYPLLVDEGRLSESAAELKDALAEPPFVELHPADSERLGLAEGDGARVRTEAGEATLPVRVSDGVAVGSAFVPYNQAGFRANELLSGRHRASAAVEPAGERAEAAAREAG